VGVGVDDVDPPPPQAESASSAGMQTVHAGLDRNNIVFTPRKTGAN
jgi:hypothetical protein